MEAIVASALPAGALLLVDTAPIVYMLEDHPRLAHRYGELFERHAAGELSFAVTTMTLAEVMTGPLRNGAEVLAMRYRQTLETWQVVALTADIAYTAASLRARAQACASRCDPARERPCGQRARVGYARS